MVILRGYACAKTSDRREIYNEVDESIAILTDLLEVAL
jgi:hypothetical protein